ncbi:MAG TPA: hypothetical protein VI895_08670 [Bdellovibrionota bacterium]|nr:hypothetical protein [Bdellovibrionota bacterium]
MLMQLGKAFLARWSNDIATRFDIVTVAKHHGATDLDQFENVLEDTGPV